LVREGDVSENEKKTIMELAPGCFFHFPHEIRMDLAHGPQEPTGEFWDGEQWRKLPIAVPDGALHS
jgi:hypothetical protein